MTDETTEAAAEAQDIGMPETVDVNDWTLEEVVATALKNDDDWEAMELIRAWHDGDGETMLEYLADLPKPKQQPLRFKVAPTSAELPELNQRYGIFYDAGPMKLKFCCLLAPAWLVGPEAILEKVAAILNQHWED